MIEFISRLPQGYQEVEYIESSGTQYIDTGFVVNKSDNYVLEIDGLFPSQAQAYQGCNGYMQFFVGSKYGISNESSISVGNRDTVRIAYANQTATLTVNGSQAESKSWASYSGANVKLGVLRMGDTNNGWFSGGEASGTIYGYKVWKDEVLVSDCIPCVRNSDNVAGVYDVIREQFITNVGSGVFAVGSNMGEIVITPGGVISFGAALRRRMMLNVKSGLPISGLPLGALIRAEDGGTGAANYEIVGFDIFSTGDCVLTRKIRYTRETCGSITKYADSSIDKRCNDTIYNAFSADLRAKIMDVVFYLASDGQITRKVFVPTATMVGNGGNEGVAFPYFNSDERRAKGEEWWTSTIYTKDYMRVVRNDGYITIGLMHSSYTGVVPTFVIPASTRYDPVPNDDGSYNLVL